MEEIISRAVCRLARHSFSSLWVSLILRPRGFGKGGSHGGLGQLATAVGRDWGSTVSLESRSSLITGGISHHVQMWPSPLASAYNNLITAIWDHSLEPIPYIIPFLTYYPSFSWFDSIHLIRDFWIGIILKVVDYT